MIGASNQRWIFCSTVARLCFEITFVSTCRLNEGGIVVEVASRSMPGSGIGVSERSKYARVKEKKSGRARSEKLCLSDG